MTEILQRSLPEVAQALRRKEISARELLSEALGRHRELGDRLGAYKLVDVEGAEAGARRADRLLAEADPPPLCGIPLSVKDLYGLEGVPTFAGTARQLPPGPWSRDGWLTGLLRRQGAVFVGKTHTVELAFGAVGINPHWGTPRNPWDAHHHRIPGGSSSGAGVSLWEGSALLALGSDTGGSIRIPAALTGTVGHRTTTGRWPTEGVVPLSRTLDAVGALTRSVADAAYFFGAVDPVWGHPDAFFRRLSDETRERSLRVAVPRCRAWDGCPAEIADVLDAALEELAARGWVRMESDGAPLESAEDLYLGGAIVGAQCRAFVEHELPGWTHILHPTVGERLREAPELGSEAYSTALEEYERSRSTAARLFEGVDVLALPTATVTPPLVSELEDLARYRETNRALLAPTSSGSLLGLSAISLPVGRDGAGMPVGLQLLAPRGADELLLAAALAAERILGPVEVRLGRPAVIEQPAVE